MEFYLSKIVKNVNMEEAEIRVTAKLKEQGFGVITQIDIKATLKNKIDVDFRPYKILGACNPQFAYEALSKVDKIGVMLPCNVCLQQSGETDVEIFAVNPLEAMASVKNDELKILANDVYERLSWVIASV